MVAAPPTVTLESKPTRVLEGIIAILNEPTPPARIRFVPQAISKEEKTALAVPYFDARFTMERLDAACGTFGWQSDVKEISGVFCVGIGILNPENGAWSWKWDTGQEEDEADEEASRPSRPDTDNKGQIGGPKALVSGGIKRAGVQWGVGRDVYSLRKKRYAITLGRSGKFQGWETQPSVDQFGAAAVTAAAHRQQQRTPPRAADANRFTELALERGLTQEQRRDHLAECVGPDGKTDWRRAVELLEATKP